MSHNLVIWHTWFMEGDPPAQTPSPTVILLFNHNTPSSTQAIFCCCISQYGACRAAACIMRCLDDLLNIKRETRSQLELLMCDGGMTASRWTGCWYLSLYVAMEIYTIYLLFLWHAGVCRHNHTLTAHLYTILLFIKSMNQIPIPPSSSMASSATALCFFRDYSKE